MMVVPEWWDTTGSHKAVARVQVWSNGELVTTTDDIIDGSVTEKWVSGVRSTLSLTVDASPEWLEWLSLPAAVLVPYSGMAAGSEEALFPHSLFPVLPPSQQLPVRALQIDVDDSWQRVVQNDFPGPVASDAYPGEIRDTIAWLLGEVGIGWPALGNPTVWAGGEPPIVSASSAAPVPLGVVWDQSRDQTIRTLADAIGADAFIDRWGAVRVADHVSQPGADLTDGVDGTVVTVQSTKDWSGVANRVIAASTAQGVSFDPVQVDITDQLHPAYARRIGTRVYRFSSNALLSSGDALNAALVLLAKRSAPALAWTVTCVPDASRCVGDLINVTTDLGTVRAVVQEVSHPFGSGVQTLKLGAA